MCLGHLETSKAAVRISTICQACLRNSITVLTVQNLATRPADLSRQQEELEVPANNRRQVQVTHFAVLM